MSCWPCTDLVTTAPCTPSPATACSPESTSATPGGREVLERPCRELEGNDVRALLHKARHMVRTTGRQAQGPKAEGADWRDLVDALRPEVPRLWSRLSGDEQLRFRRHLERLWNVNRHRMAPPVARTVYETSELGHFLRPFRRGGGGGRGRQRPATAGQAAGESAPLRLEDRLVGQLHRPGPAALRHGQPLMDALLARRAGPPWTYRDGASDRPAGPVLDAQGQPSPWLWAVGPLRQGQLLESTAVPEIRVQARDIALEIDMSLVDLGAGSGAATARPALRPPAPPALKAVRAALPPPVLGPRRHKHRPLSS